MHHNEFQRREEALAAAPRHDGLEGGGSIDYPWWAPTFWHGMGLKAWIGLLQEGSFRVSPSRLGVATSITLLSGCNSLLRLTTDLKYRQRLRNSTLPRDPIFIIGHWRTGTTLLHELMMLDPQFCAPSTYQCFAPGHFLTTRGFTRRSYAQALLPSRRPGDNVKAGWSKPQEDEFALMNLGAPSPYRRIAFPHAMPATPQALDLNGLSPRERQQWQSSCRDFILRLQLKDRRRLVLKSPTHTARIGTLLEMFPEARFIHIVRNPFTVFPSTKRLWQSLHKTQSLQKKLPENLDDYIINCFREMQMALQRDRQLLPSNQLHELRYEDLIQDPLASLSAAYARLNLGDVEPMAQALAEHLPDIYRYQVNSYRISAQLKGEIASQFASFFRTYHYCPDTGAALPIPAG